MSKRPEDPGYAAGWCIHFRSMGSFDSCEAGIAYDTLPSQFKQKPCFLDANGESKPGTDHCEKLRRPTSKEIEDHAEWSKRRIDMLTIVMHGIADWRKRYKRQSASETVECPVCKGRLYLRIANNGHIHGKCGTLNCVEWME